mgnify:CR=1 FL=1
MSLISRNTPTYSKSDVRKQHLGQAADGGLHFDGAAGNIDIASPPDLGTKFSFEFVVKADSWKPSTSGNVYLLDFDTGGRFILGSTASSPNNGNLSIYDNTTWRPLGVKVLDDLKVHHLVLTVDGTANTATLFDNGNQVATATIGTGHAIDSCTDLKIGSNAAGSSSFFDGTISRLRLHNRTLSASEVKEKFENKNLEFSEQWASQTDLINANSSGSGSAFTGASSSTAPTGWSPAGSPRIYTIDSSSGSGSEPALKIEAGAANVGIKWGSAATLGKKYRLSFSYKNGDADTVMAYRLTDTGAFVNLANSTSWSHNNIVEFTGDGVTGGLMFRVNTSGKLGHFDNIKLEAVGCVSSFELQTANPSQSLMVQDSSGAADGTCSASGITQIQPLTQINAEELRVAGTTPKIGVGLANTVTPAGKLHVHGADGDGYLRLSTDTTGATATDGARIGYNASDLRVQNYENSKIQFFTNNTTEALVIDSAGVLGVGNPAPNGAMEISRGGSGTESIISTWSTTDAEHSQLSLKKSSSATINTKAVTASGESLGAINAYGVDTNTDQRRAARIEFNQAAAATGSKVAGNMVFKTSSTSANDVTAMTIDSAGVVTVGSGHTATLNIDAPTHDGSQASQAILNFKYAHSGAPSPVGYIKLEENAVNSFDGTLKFGVPYNNGSGGSATREAMTISSAGLATFANGITLSGGITTLGSFTELTIASGAVTVTSSVHRVDTESNAGTDDLDTINGGTDGSILILSCADNGRDVVFKDGTGNLKLNGDFTATNKADTITLIHYGSEWREVSRSDNA